MVEDQIDKVLVFSLLRCASLRFGPVQSAILFYLTMMRFMTTFAKYLKPANRNRIKIFAVAFMVNMKLRFSRTAPVTVSTIRCERLLPFRSPLRRLKV